MLQSVSEAKRGQLLRVEQVDGEGLVRPVRPRGRVPAAGLVVKDDGPVCPQQIGQWEQLLVPATRTAVREHGRGAAVGCADDPKPGVAIAERHHSYAADRSLRHSPHGFSGRPPGQSLDDVSRSGRN